VDFVSEISGLGIVDLASIYIRGILREQYFFLFFFSSICSGKMYLANLWFAWQLPLSLLKTAQGHPMVSFLSLSFSLLLSTFLNLFPVQDHG
jgi:hypothetical protein